MLEIARRIKKIEDQLIAKENITIIMEQGRETEAQVTGTNTWRCFFLNNLNSK